MKQQTAVEWLIEQLIKADKELDGRRKNEDATVLKMNPTKIYEQAKAMEKEQIIKAVRAGHQFYEDGFVPWMGEQYYNETYKL
jgi:hypothetical protein